jgi:hypothetical protein
MYVPAAVLVVTVVRVDVLVPVVCVPVAVLVVTLVCVDVPVWLAWAPVAVLVVDVDCVDVPASGVLVFADCAQAAATEKAKTAMRLRPIIAPPNRSSESAA